MRVIATLVLLAIGDEQHAVAAPPLQEDFVEFEALTLGGNFYTSADGPRDFVIRNEERWCEFWNPV
jgi:hypothetical protein